MSLAACISRCPRRPAGRGCAYSLAGGRLEHRGLRLLDLQEQRIGAVASEHQQDPGTRPDAAHAHDLARESTHRNARELAAVLLERPAVVAEQLCQPHWSLRAVGVDARESPDRHDHRRIGDDPRLAVDLLGQLRQRLHAVFVRALACRRLRVAALWRPAPGDRLSIVATSSRAYQTSGCSSRRAAPSTPVARDREHDRRACAPRSRCAPAISKLAARRFTSHSNGPG